MCNQRKLCDNNCELCFNRSFASHPKSEFWSDSNKKTPRQVFKSSKNKVFFDCNICNHTFESNLNNINNGKWCNFCSNKLLCNDNNCKICFNRSFASHPKSMFWSNLNKELPRKVFKSSGNKYMFHCDKCNHIFTIQLDSINKGRQWCSFCANQKLCEEENCVKCFNNSFSSHPKSEFWSDLNKEIPREVFKSSGKKYLFNCDKCSHQFESSLGYVNQGKWCSYCSNKLLCNDNDCDICFNKSFASHPKSNFWSGLNKELPRGVFKNSGNKYFFDCDKCNHQFKSSLGNINTGTWYPKCVNKTELIIYNYLLELHTGIDREVTFNWCLKKRFDFIIHHLHLIIELDGCGHFQQVSNWQPHEETRKNDIFKMKCAFDNKFSIIRIQQDFVFADKLDWKTMLNNYIKCYEKPTVIFIGDAKYHQHIIETDFTENIIIHLI